MYVSLANENDSGIGWQPVTPLIYRHIPLSSRMTWVRYLFKSRVKRRHLYRNCLRRCARFFVLPIESLVRRVDGHPIAVWHVWHRVLEKSRKLLSPKPACPPKGLLKPVWSLWQEYQIFVWKRHFATLPIRVDKHALWIFWFHLLPPVRCVNIIYSLHPTKIGLFSFFTCPEL